VCKSASNLSAASNLTQASNLPQAISLPQAICRRQAATNNLPLPVMSWPFLFLRSQANLCRKQSLKSLASP